MAVTIESLAVALRLQAGGTVAEPLLTELTRLRDAAQSIVTSYGSTDVPEAVENEAVMRIANYLYSMPDSPMSDKYADVVRYSAADALLRPYKSFGIAVI